MLAFILFILQTAVHEALAEYHFVKQPLDTDVVIEGMSLELQCEAIITLFQGQNYDVHWQLNGSNFKDVTHSKYEINENKNSNRYNLSLTSILTIFNVSLQDGGLYHCNLYSASGPALIASNGSRAAVIPKPRFLREPRNVSAIEGGTATMLCAIQALDSSIMSVKWTQEDLGTVNIGDNTNSMDKGDDDRYSIIGGNHVGAYHLQILKLRRSDAGMFYCSVKLKTSGKVILKSQMAMLEVLYPPDETYPSCISVESKNYSAGDTLTTECISRGGNGPLRLSWIRNGEEINGTRVSNKDPDIRDKWTLTATDNGGNITCVIKGKAILKRSLCVIGPLSVYFGPIISVEPKTAQVFLGQPAIFKCSVNANPPITVTYLWFLNGEQLDNSNADLKINWNGIANHSTSTKLEINVTCATDGANSRISDSAVITIKNRNISTEPTTSPEIQKGLSTLLVYTIIGVLCFLLTVIVLRVSVYMCRTKKVNNKKAHNVNDPFIDAACELRTFQRCEIASAQQTLPGDNDNDEYLLNSRDVAESTSSNDYEEATTHEYENIHRREVGHTYQSLTSRSSDTYMKLNHLTRIKHN